MAALKKLNEALGQPTGPVAAAATGSKAAEAGAPPGTEDLSPEQMDQIKRVSLMAQAALADDQGGEQIVMEASKGQEGLFSAVSGLLKIVVEKMQLDREMIIPAAVTIMIIVLKFLTDIGKASAGPDEIGKLAGGLAAVIGAEYGFSADEIAAMTQQMPTEGGMRQGATMQRAKSGPIGAMVNRATEGE